MRLADPQAALIEDIAGFSNDPLGFVRYAFAWGEGELSEHPGPDAWQDDILVTIGAKLRAGASVQEAIQIAVASGHGIGKSALVSWLILWAISTHEDTKGVVTAGTENQLKTKTWAELAKWYRLCITREWFDFTATALFAKDPQHAKTWRFDMVPWSERNTEAFAGLHNRGKRIVLIFDEASQIDDMIWEVSEGALTDADTEILWLAFGNPTRNIGRFRDCFGRFSHRWERRQIDSRTARMTNKGQLQRWVDDYGEDSDFVRVRVRGVFPATAANALLGPEDCEAAMGRRYGLEAYGHAAKILGVDVARQGIDRSAIVPRQGLTVFRPKVLRIADTMLLAQEVARAATKWGADAIFVDGTGGFGAGVVDALRHLGFHPVEVQFSGRAGDPRYLNKRSEMYFELAAWVKGGGALPRDDDLKRELAATTYRFQGDKFRLSEKEEIRAEIGESPDLADALALTFAYPVQPSLARVHSSLDQAAGRVLHDYNPLSGG